jgi:para-aminobenzoate synthetase component 1
MMVKNQAIQWANKHFNFFCFLDSNAYKHGFGNQEFDWIIGMGNSLFQPKSLMEFLESENEDRKFYHFTYDLKNWIEPLLSSTNKSRFQVQPINILDPEVVLLCKDNKLWIERNKSNYKKIINSIGQEEVETNFKPTDGLQGKWTEEEYINAYNRCLKELQQGNIYEVNLCQEFYMNDFDTPILPLFFAMNDSAKAPFSSLFKMGEYWIASVSPERFLFQDGQKIVSQPIKGTRKRGKTDAEDLALVDELKNSLKENSENTMIVDLVRNDLSFYAQKASVEVEDLCKIYTFPHVHQMISTISCQLNSEKDFWNAFLQAYPMGSMTGVPKISAMELIDDVEDFKRNSYSGTIGFKKGNTADFNVLIRSLMINEKLKMAHLPVGGAITIRSSAEEEYQECLVKMNGINKILCQGKTK